MSPQVRDRITEILEEAFSEMKACRMYPIE